MKPSSVLFAALFVQVGLWFWLSRKMFRLLAVRHPQKYEEMGRPTVFLNNSIKNGWAFTRFFYGRHYVSLGDPEVNRVAGLMWVLPASM